MRHHPAFRYFMLAAFLAVALVVSLAILRGFSALDEALFTTASMAAVATKPRKRKPRLVAYVRVSALGKRDEADLNSPHDQEAAIRAYCEQHGFEIVDVVVDLNESGAKAQRKKLRAIVARIKSGDVDGIAVLKLNRLSRLNPLERAELFHEIEEQGRGYIVSATQGHEWKTRQQRFIRDIFVAMDRYEWEEKNEEFELQKRNAVALGVHITGKVPVGFNRRDVKPRKLYANEDAEHITGVFHLRAYTDATLGDCLRYLQQHLPTVVDPKNPDGDRIPANWTRRRLQVVLTGRVYLGEAWHGSAINPDAHDALVDADTFRLVQAKFTKRDKPARPAGTTNLMAGLIRCDCCGYAMERQISNRVYLTYRCKRRSEGCEAPASVMAPAVDALVIEAVTKRMAKFAKSGGGISVAERTAQRDSLLATIAVKTDERTAWATPATRTLVGDPAWTNGLVELDDAIADLNVQLAALAPTHDERPPLADALEVFANGTTADKREIIAGELESVSVIRAPRGTAVADRLTFHWVGDGTAPVPGHHPEIPVRELAA